MEHLEKVEGYKYTQAQEELDILERIIAEQLYTPDGQSSLWKKITDAEAADYQEQIDAARKEQEEKFNNGEENIE